MKRTSWEQGARSLELGAVNREQLFFPSCQADRLGIGKVAEAAGGQFVLDQVLGADHVNRNVIDEGFDPLWPCLVEGHSIDLLQDVDAEWWLTDLKNRVGIVAEVSGIDPGQRRSVSGKSAIDDFTVGAFRTHKNVEVFCRSRFGVDSNRIATDKQILNPVCVECE